MVAPCSTISDMEFELHSASSDADFSGLIHKDETDESPPTISDMEFELHSASSDAGFSGLIRKDETNESPLSASGADAMCSMLEYIDIASPVNVQESPLCPPAMPNRENHVDAHECPTLSTLVGVLAQNPDAPALMRVECSAGIGSIDQSSKATCMSMVSNSHVRVADSCRGDTLASMQAPPPTGVMSICGMRPEMEDAVTIAHNFTLVSCTHAGGCSGACVAHGYEQGAEIPLHFFGVYDGHGGSQVSSLCKDRLHIKLAKEFRSVDDIDRNDASNACMSWQERWEKAMFSCFHQMDADVEGFIWRGAPDSDGSVKERISEPLAPETVGSTAVVAVVGSRQIVVANCGDSRAVLSRGGHAIALSVDHKPNREDEMARIEAAGGRVICWNGYRVFGVLAMSRAIGDRYLKPYVISEPEVKCISRMEDDECLILASDGLWDVLTNEEVCEVVRRCLTRRVAASDGSKLQEGFTLGSNCKNAEAAAALLTKMALAQGSHDNISVVVVDLKDRRRN